jgi:DNA-binding Lrp family transcriptional regulator
MTNIAEVIRHVAEQRRVSLDKLFKLVDYLQRYCRDSDAESENLRKCTAAEIAKNIGLNRPLVWSILKELEVLGVVRTRYVLVETGDIGRTVRRVKVYFLRSTEASLHSHSQLS